MGNVSAMFACKLTGRSGRPVKAHVVPKAFYEFPLQAEGPYRLMTNAPGVHPKRIPAGIYDHGIVTSDGEALFSPWDDYACQILLRRIEEFQPIMANGEALAWQLSNVDYGRLKLFGLSVLWRANASTQPVFRRVKLANHEPRIRRMLLRGDPGEAEDYSVILARWNDATFGPVLMDPFRERYDGVNYYRIYCGRYILHVKVDKRRTGDRFAELQLTPGGVLFVVARDFDHSKERPLMAKVAWSNVR